MLPKTSLLLKKNAAILYNSRVRRVKNVPIQLSGFLTSLLSKTFIFAGLLALLTDLINLLTESKRKEGISLPVLSFNDP
jgi:hypothetical protein